MEKSKNIGKKLAHHKGDIVADKEAVKNQQNEDDLKDKDDNRNEDDLKNEDHIK